MNFSHYITKKAFCQGYYCLPTSKTPGGLTKPYLSAIMGLVKKESTYVVKYINKLFLK